MIGNSRLILLGLVVCLTGCQSEVESRTDKQVFVDTKTEEVFVLDSGVKSPAIHPKTGKKTLRRGLYCSECKKWYAVPELEVVQRNPEAAFCPINKTKLSVDGPLPTLENSVEQKK